MGASLRHLSVRVCLALAWPRMTKKGKKAAANARLVQERALEELQERERERAAKAKRRRRCSQESTEGEGDAATGVSQGGSGLSLRTSPQDRAADDVDMAIAAMEEAKAAFGRDFGLVQSGKSAV